MGKNEKNKYVGGGDADQMELDERDIMAAREADSDNRRKVILAVIATVIAITVVVVYFAVARSHRGVSQSKKLVKTYMEGLEEGDVDKVRNVMDPAAVDDASMNTMVSIFETYKDQNIEYTVDYSMEEGREASENDLQAVSSTLYSASPKRTGVTAGYIIPVKGTILLTYKEQSSPYELDMDIICYEKDGEWYLGGTVED